EGCRPKLLVVVKRQVLALDRAERLVKVPQALARSDPLDRNPAEVSPELGQHLVFEAVERGEIHMPALGFDHLIMIALPQEHGDAKTRPRPYDRGNAIDRKG